MVVSTLAEVSLAILLAAIVYFAYIFIITTYRAWTGRCTNCGSTEMETDDNGADLCRRCIKSR